MRMIALLVAVCCAGPAPADDGFVPLFNGKDLSGWVPVNVAPSTFTVADGMIICSGKPTGIMRTDRHYENFIVELEWRHMVAGGNAGFFLWGDPVPALGGPFTRGIEVQVLDGRDGDWYTSHGDVFPIWGAKLKPDNPRGGDRAFPTELRSKPSPQWNHYRIECRDGNVSVAVNGKVVTTGREASPRKGYLCLESEGGIVHWRNLRIKELPPSQPPPAPEHIAKLDEGYRTIYTGVDFSGWKTEGAAGEHWKVSDWTFFYDGKGPEESRTLWTERELGDYQAFLDFRTEKATEVVVLPRGESGPAIRLGDGTPGLRKAGQWNRLTFGVEKGKVSAALNGEPVQVSESSTPPGPAPIGLRAVGVTSFASVFVRPLD